VLPINRSCFDLRNGFPLADQTLSPILSSQWMAQFEFEFIKEQFFMKNDIRSSRCTTGVNNPGGNG
jgi:hypothetical protein